MIDLGAVACRLSRCHHHGLQHGERQGLHGCVGLPFCQDFLKDALPFLEDMAVIEIDPASFG